MKDARDIGLVVCDFMDVDEYEAEGVPVRGYYLKTGATDAYRELEPQFVKDAFAELTSTGGPYARDSYTIVQGVEGGMEYAGFAVVSGASFVEGNADDFN